MKHLAIAVIVATSMLSVSPADAPTAQASVPTTTIALPLVTPAQFAQWGQVAWCETHSNWSREGSWHDGGLGMTQAAWVKYGGLTYAPRPHLATPEEQVLIATRINAGYQVPDQDGECHAW